jgi:energy-coupling factor transport system substrate-specific component
MGLRLAALGFTVAALAAVPAAQSAESVSTRFLASREQPGGGFAEQNGTTGLALTAWGVLALRAHGVEASAATREYLVRTEPKTVPELALATMAREATGAPTAALVARLRRAIRPSGLIGPTLNATIWSVLALRQVGEPVPVATKRLLLARQARSGGWGWSASVAPDSNDTAAAIQALRALGVGGTRIGRGLRFLRRHQNRDGGFELSDGRGSDSQSTAWAIQAFVAARAAPPRTAFAYLARMRRPDGSYRYSARYPAATPVWVTAQVLPAVARKPFPLR